MAKDTYFRKKTTLNARGTLIDLSTPKVMGIINLTPDSFYDQSRKPHATDALMQAEKMLADGAAFLDLGAYSSRPGAIDISVQEEMDRLLPAVEAISGAFPEAILSIDTFRASVAEAAIKGGAHIINDISGGQLDEQMFETVARLQVPYILMHTRGTPQTMTQLTDYDDIFTDVFDYLQQKYAELKKLGVEDVILDPGFGFAKKSEQSYELLNRMHDFDILGLPILVGVSRKRMIYNITGGTATDALNGTTVVNTIALTKGANILRVHDVKEVVEAIKIYNMLQQ
ncbi:dihydropteroate synthase [Mucilaginibacter jinjuensis]|uniref:Dihydropteroate synthase n=1 Tax=Mucilaginibacter jinjuensis TaxID=1176721 RepID=A0ABY7T668_9SPHI|nr:dihydropteroate synthase [Mucilaginibacter jinjuensis]WCT11713.1 dihydropteroate synthase [Mucilaginibacter jinjuensis]